MTRKVIMSANIDELSVKIDGAAGVAWCLHETMSKGESTSASYNMAAYGLHVLLDYLAADADELAEQEAKVRNRIMTLPGNDR